MTSAIEGIFQVLNQFMIFALSLKFSVFGYSVSMMEISIVVIVITLILSIFFRSGKV